MKDKRLFLFLIIWYIFLIFNSYLLYFYLHIYFNMSKKSLTCSICNLTFQKVNSLNNHMELHLKFSSYKCEICDELYSDDESFKLHQDSHIDKNSEIEDNTISIYNEIPNLDNTNVQEKNNDVIEYEDFEKQNSYECEMCWKVFTNLERLKLHIQKCNDQIYKCDLCDKIFKTKSGLAKHKITHVAKSPFLSKSQPLKKEIFKCQICQKAFTSQKRFKLHNQNCTRTIFKCDKCDKNFKTRFSLNRHKDAHISKGPFICTICGEEFQQMVALTAHIRVHNTNGNYEYIGGPNQKVFRDGIINEKVQLKKLSNEDVQVLCYAAEPDIDIGLDDMENIPKVETLTISDLTQTSENEDHLKKYSSSLNSIESYSNSELDNSEFENILFNFNNYSVKNLSEEFINDAFLQLKLPKESPDKLSSIFSNFPQRIEIKQTFLNDEEKSQDNNDGTIFILPQSMSDEHIEIATTGNDISPLVEAPSLEDFTSSDFQKLSDESLVNLSWCNTSIDPTNKIFKVPIKENLEVKTIKVGSKKTKKYIKKMKVNVKEKEKPKSYICEICNKDCKKSSIYHVHMRSHTGEKPYYCNICKMGFKQLAHLKSHSFRHTGERPYKCSQCGKGFTQVTSMRVHEKNVHKIKPNKKSDKKQSNFYCKICDKTFMGVCYRVDHTKEHEIKDKKYKCDFCELICTSKIDIKNHIITDHVNDVLKDVKESTMNFNECLKMDSEFQCPHCSETFNKKSELTNHTKSHKKDQFYCHYCSKSFNVIMQFKQHMNKHYGIKPYMCNACFKCFLSENGVNYHIKTVHKGNANVIKNVDGNLDNNESISLNPTINDKDKTIVIDVSNDANSEYSNSIHMYEVDSSTIKNENSDEENKLKKEKKYLIEKSTNIKKNVKKELNRKNNDFNINKKPAINMKKLFSILEQNFICNICENKDKFESNELYDHFITHKGSLKIEWICPIDICSEQFSNLKSLRDHIGNHKIASKYKCKNCENSFKSQHILDTHKINNCINTSFKCKVCDDVYSDYMLLKNHKCLISRLSERKFVRTTYTKVIVDIKENDTKKLILNGMSSQEPDYSFLLYSNK